MRREIRPTFLNTVLVFGGGMAACALYLGWATQGFSSAWIAFAAKLGFGAGLCFAILIFLWTKFASRR